MEPLKSPELRRSAEHWLVSVPAGQAREAVKLWREHAAAGFFFNGALGCDQATIDAVLKDSKPRRILVANIDSLDYSSIYACRSLRVLLLGYGCHWPDFSRLQELEEFSAMEPYERLEDIPAGLLGLSLYGYREHDLTVLPRLRFLKKLDLRMAPKLVNLDGLSPTIVDLSLAGCSRLQSIAAICACRLSKLYLSQCRSLKDVDDIYGQNSLIGLMLDKVPAEIEMDRIRNLKLESCYINGTRLYGKMES